MALALPSLAGTSETLSHLLDPEKIATIKNDRPANTRLYKILGHLESGRQNGENPATVVEKAIQLAGYGGTVAAEADKAAILRDREILAEFGCFTPGGLAELKKGQAPTIMKGEDAGDSVALDHVLPRAIVPELAGRFYNLQAIPSRKNSAKGAKIGQRELGLARSWRKRGLLSGAGLAAVEKAANVSAVPTI